MLETPSEHEKRDKRIGIYERKKERESKHYIALDGIFARRPHETNCGTIVAEFPLVANLSGYAIWPASLGSLASIQRATLSQAR